MSTTPAAAPSRAALRDAVTADGGRLLRWRARQVHRRAGGTTAVFEARVRWANRDQDETYVVDASAERVRTWRFPLDPDLPALAEACDPARVRDLLVALGRVGRRTRPDDVRLVRRAYRPGQRAVVEARAGAARAFLKVTRSGRVGELHRRQRLLQDAGVPVAAPLHVAAEGLLVLAPLPGRPLSPLVRGAGAAALDPQRLLAVLDALPPALLSFPERPAWAEHAGHYARLVGAVVPREAGRAARLGAAVQEGLVALQEPVCPVHGDLYEAHLRVRSGRVTGLLDVDGAGPGRRSDDLACLLGHLEVLALVHPQDGPRVHGAAVAWGAHLVRGSGVDPRAVRLRTAGVLLSLATEPHRRQQPRWEAATSARLDLAESWLTRSPLDGGS